jgi:uncharacterized membrane protein YkvA (DUF1232 family)
VIEEEPEMPDQTPDDLSTAVAEDFQSFDVQSAEAAFGSSGSRLPSKGLLSFYDRLRGKIIKTVEKRGGRLSEDAVRALLLVPDIFILLLRLTLDKNVPKPTRALIGGTLAYFVLPFDLFPEGLLGGIGYMDDIVLATAVLAQSFSGDLEPYARKHWSGSEDLRVVIRDITETAHSLLGENLFEKVKKLLHRRGIQVESAPARGRVDDDFE